MPNPEQALPAVPLPCPEAAAPARLLAAILDYPQPTNPAKQGGNRPFLGFQSRILVDEYAVLKVDYQMV